MAKITNDKVPKFNFDKDGKLIFDFDDKPISKELLKEIEELEDKHFYRGVSKKTRDKISEGRRILGFVPSIVNSFADLAETIESSPVGLPGIGPLEKVIQAGISSNTGKTPKELTK